MIESTLTQAEAGEIIEKIQQDKIESSPSYKAAYIKNKVMQYAPKWWDAWLQDMDSEDPMDRRLARIEFNKLQARILPTTLTDTEGNGIVVNLVSYKDMVTKKVNTEEVKQLDDSNTKNIITPTNENRFLTPERENKSVLPNPLLQVPGQSADEKNS